MVKVRALFVSLVESYPELEAQTFGSEALKNCTCGWWHIDLESAKDIKYIFGVQGGHVVSVYRIRNDEDAHLWPSLIFRPEESALRRYVPANRVTIPEWQDATSWVDINMRGGPIRYGTVEEDKGILAPAAPSFDRSNTASTLPAPSSA